LNKFSKIAGIAVALNQEKTNIYQHAN